MRVAFTFVPPGGGEADYGLVFDLPAVPQPGDYICISRTPSDQPGFHEDFIVRRTWWHLETPETRASHTSGEERIGKASEIVCECEFAEGAWSSDAHKRSVKMYETRGKGRRDFENTAY